jgi:hypothetical protein
MSATLDLRRLTHVAEAVHCALDELENEEFEATAALLVEALEILEQLGAAVELLPVTDAELAALLRGETP